jgi:type VII secretion integral membrane protein EccD
MPATGTGTDLSRVTVIAPNSRMDLALPSAVPLADLLPAVLRGAGDGLADEGLRHGGWAVQRLGEPPLDTAQSLAALGVRDGELLYLRPRRDQLPETAFDDVVDAIAVALADRADRWRHDLSRPVARVGGVALLALGLAVLTLSGPQWTIPAVVSAVLAVGLLVAAGALSRGLGDGVTGAVLGISAVPYGFAAGLLAFGQAQPFGQLFSATAVLVGFAAALVVAVLSAVLVAAVLPAFLAAGSVAAAGVVGGLVAVLGSPGGAAAVVAALVLALTPLLPVTAYRISALPRPFVPAGAQDMRRDTETLPGAEALRKAVVADQALTGLVAGTALNAAACAVLLGGGTGWATSTLAGLIAGLLCLRSRLFTGRAQRLWLLGAGLVGVIAVAVQLATELTGLPALAFVLAPVLGLAVVLLVVAARAGVEGRRAPLGGRLADIAELLGILAVVPIGLVVLGVYDYVRTLWG